nr:flagellar hook capping FlgD N-terminal domain-containing protein [Shewanella putrefaciens]
MIAQIKNQDPTKPLNSAEYISQLAQFSQVESLEGMRKNQSNQMIMMENLGIVQSASLIGKNAWCLCLNLSSMVKRLREKCIWRMRLKHSISRL